MGLGEDTLLNEQPYHYLTVDEMKSLGDDSLPIDVTQDDRHDSNRDLGMSHCNLRSIVQYIHNPWFLLIFYQAFLIQCNFWFC